MSERLVRTALAYLAAGLSVVPIPKPWPDPAESKDLSYNWSPYQSAPMSESVARREFAHAWGCCIVTGKVSGGLLALDFDTATAYTMWRDALEKVDPTLAESLVVERTTNDGYHVFVRVPGDVPKNQKLAIGYIKRKERDGAIIETRGEGGLIYCAPTEGYKIVQGRLDRIPSVSADELELLFMLARGLSEKKPPIVEPRPKTGGAVAVGDRPGDHYNNSDVDWADLLEPDGWTLFRAVGDVRYWTRPGKETGTSATTGLGRGGQDLLYVHSTSVDLEPGITYTKFAYRAMTEFNGDWGAATRAVATELGLEKFPKKVNIGIAENDVDSPGGFVDKSTGEVLGPFAFTDLGNAEMLLAVHGADLRYCASLERWLVWSSKHWQWDETNGALVTQRYIDCVKRLCADPLTQEWGFKCQSIAKAQAAIAFAKKMAGVPVTVEELDAHPFDLNTQDGIVNLLDGTIRPHDRTALCTKITTCGVRDIPTPTWDKFLRDISCVDAEWADALLRYIGYCMTGSTQEQVFMLAVGNGRNGKSTLAQLVLNILGDYGGDLPSSMIVSSRLDKPAHEMESLKGIRFAKCDEPDKARSLDREFMKKLVSGDTQKVCAKYGHPYDLKPRLKLWLMSNHKPKVEFDYAFRRRCLVMPFDLRLEDDAVLPDLINSLMLEADGILLALIGGCLRWHQQGLLNTERMKAELASYEEDNDDLAVFIAEECEEDAGYFVHPTAMLTAYNNWADRNHLDKVDVKTLKARMRVKGWKTEKKGKMALWSFSGVQLKQEAEKPVYRGSSDD